MICNGDEGDPGAFMDASIMDGDPHAVIEGMMIASYAIGAHEGYIYVRAEYPLAVKRLRMAIAAAEERGFLGDDIFGSGWAFHLKIKEGAGAFVCGEETALIASIEGKRGMPRKRPPFPAVSGLWGKPTNINNVETYSNVPWIIANGAEAYAAWAARPARAPRPSASPARSSTAASPRCPMGSTLRHVIFDVGGGIKDGREFKAVQLGGPSGGCVPASLLDTPVDYESLAATGAIVGSGGMVVADDTTCMVDLARYFLQFTQNESCGKCVPCRLGTKRMLEILERITAGEGQPGRHRDARDAGAGHQEDEPLRPRPDGAQPGAHHHHATSATSTRRTSTSSAARRSACEALIAYTIDAEACTGCTLCAKTLPGGARPVARRSSRTSSTQDLCIKCDSCRAACKFDAVKVVSGAEAIAAARGGAGR